MMSESPSPAEKNKEDKGKKFKKTPQETKTSLWAGLSFLTDETNIRAIKGTSYSKITVAPFSHLPAELFNTEVLPTTTPGVLRFRSRRNQSYYFISSFPNEVRQHPNRERKHIHWLWPQYQYGTDEDFSFFRCDLSFDTKQHFFHPWNQY